MSLLLERLGRHPDHGVVGEEGDHLASSPPASSLSQIMAPIRARKETAVPF
jgi:hypothetical protein